MKKLLSLSLFLSVFSHAENIDISKELLDRNRLNILTQDPLVKNYLFNDEVGARLSQWLVRSEIREYVVDCQNNLRAFFRTPRILGAVCYFLRQDEVEKRKSVFPLIERYSLEFELALKEISVDPRYSAADKSKALGLYNKYTGASSEALRACFASLMAYSYPADLTYPFSPFQETRRCLVSKFSHLTKNISQEFPHHPGHLISETSWVGGNKIDYLAKNEISEEIRLKIEKTLNLVPSLYPLEGKGSLSAFLNSNPDEVFTTEEGFDPVESHYAWSQKEGIFYETLQALNRAEDTIFVDIFFLGGSTGVSLAKHLVKLLEEKPKLKALILRDQINHFGHIKSMMPVFNFLLAYSLKNPSKLVILPADITAHKSGLPGFIAPLITDDLLTKTGIQDHLKLYGGAKSDHSKVFVVDGKVPTSAQALVGSKNLTDASGPFCYDEVISVYGPAAAVVLDDFYLDMKYALEKVDYTARPYNLSGYPSYVEHLAKEGWSKGLYRSGQSKAEMIANILRPFDLLDRKADMQAQRSEVQVASRGTATVRNGMTNVDSTRRNLVDQVIQAIKFAQNKIIIKDQFMFERNIVLALIEAKKRAEQEGRVLEIKILLEPLAVAKPIGMPNLLYLDRLKEAKIEVKWMQTYPFKPFVNGQHLQMSPEQIHALHDISQELHQKTISVDGKFVIAGSANKDQTTMYGAFREAQLDVYDAQAVKVHDDVFYEYWNNPELSHPFEKFDFEVPEGLKGPDGKVLTPAEFVVTIRNILSILYDWTVVN